MRLLAIGLLAAGLLAAMAGCAPKDTEAGRIEKRARALKYAVLPSGTRVEGPKGVYVNSEVARILVVTEPPGCEVASGGKTLGVTPCEIPASALVASAADSKFALAFSRGGAAQTVLDYALRIEAAEVFCGVAREALPAPLPSRDLWFFAVLAKQ